MQRGSAVFSYNVIILVLMLFSVLVWFSGGTWEVNLFVDLAFAGCILFIVLPAKDRILSMWLLEAREIAELKTELSPSSRTRAHSVAVKLGMRLNAESGVVPKYLLKLSSEYLGKFLASFLTDAYSPKLFQEMLSSVKVNRPKYFDKFLQGMQDRNPDLIEVLEEYA